jgi:hypothetical protein
MNGHDEHDDRQEPCGGDEKAHGRNPRRQLFALDLDRVRKESK